MSRTAAPLRIVPYLATFTSSTSSTDSTACPEETIEIYAASHEEALARAKTFSFHTLHKRAVVVSPPLASTG